MQETIYKIMKCCEENIFKPLIECKKPTNPIVSITVFDSKFWRVKNGKIVIKIEDENNNHNSNV